MPDDNILLWLPSPMGDAILCTPALRAIRKHFESSKITFFGNGVAQQILSPSKFNDQWLTHTGKCPLTTALMFRKHKFTQIILFKNSFAAALTARLADIPVRIGYSRELRGCLLTDKLHPPKLPNGKFKPTSMIDYYSAIASWLGADISDRTLELFADPSEEKSLQTKLPQLSDCKGPLVILVPGGAFGPSKCWLSVSFAQTADWLISNYNATVIVSVSHDQAEKQIAKDICESSTNKLINLAENPLSLGELKTLFSKATLVISNDTGPRHIAIAFKRKLITLFGPNDPAWTDTGYEDEIKIVGNAPCVPCAKPVCEKSEHLCMQAITVEMVCEAAKKFLEDEKKKTIAGSKQEFIEVSKSFTVDADYKTALEELGLDSIDSIFSFSAGVNLTKDNLAKHRSRLKFEINQPPTTLFLKRYNKPPVLVQLKNWLCHRKRISLSASEVQPAKELTAEGINTLKIVCYGEHQGKVFEKRSFAITEKIPNAEALERKLPSYFDEPATAENLSLRKEFIAQLACFVRKFHETGYRHRDLYLAHIFHDDNGEFYLIDLARSFKPKLLGERFRKKDIAQLYYSAQGKYFSKSDRLRFYFEYTGRGELTRKDKIFISQIKRKAKRMQRHDKKHGRQAPFAN
ncbi:MAG: lipopolysaccharide heptosyltransferase II [Planctomycetes bacterium]|nr:lipopolysaccharide heptosyltransferase II [Planctomycetota bacterium]